MKDFTGFEKTVLAVTFNVSTNQYTVGACQGSSVNEMAFAVMVVIKALLKEGHIKNKEDFTNLIEKYYNDPQYEEVNND